MRALVTNDDGVTTTGLRTLAAVAVEAGLDVVVAAPHTERSGASASLTVVEQGGRLLVHEQPIAGLDGVRVLGVEATPAFIALTASHGAFGPPPQIVLSGVNHGPNTGHAVLHSGTVGAALTGSTRGVPALAVSMNASKPAHWETAAEVARRSLAWVLEHGGGDVVLNVNVPDVPLDALRGLRHARLAAFGAVQAEVREIGEGYVTLTFSEVQAEHEPGTDADLLAQGWATATPLVSPCEAPGVDLSKLDDTTRT